MEIENAYEIKDENVLDFSNEAGIARSSFKILNAIFISTGMRGNAKYECTRTILSYIISNSTDPSKPELKEQTHSSILPNLCRELGVPMPKEAEKAMKTPKEEAAERMKEAGKREDAVVEDVQHMQTALANEIRMIKSAMTDLELCRKESEKGIASVKEKPFIISFVINRIEGILNNIMAHLRENVVREEELTRLSEHFLQNLKNIDMERISDPAVSYLSKAVEDRRTMVLPSELIKIDKEEFRSDPRKIRNLVLIYSLLSKKLTEDENIAEDAYYECAVFILNNKWINDDINNYFESVNRMNQDLGKYKGYLKSLEGVAGKMKRLFEYMNKNKESKDALQGREGALQVITGCIDELKTMGDELGHLKENVDRAATILMKLRQFVVDRLQMEILDRITRRRAGRPSA